VAASVSRTSLPSPMASRIDAKYLIVIFMPQPVRKAMQKTE
jgi:hypothetical protein